MVRLKASGDLSVHTPAAAVSPARTAMGAAVHSPGVPVAVALEVSPAAIRPEVFQGVTPLEASLGGTPLEASPVVIPPAAVFQVAMVGVAEAVNKSS
jgi:hypothetical protein